MKDEILEAQTRYLLDDATAIRETMLHADKFPDALGTMLQFVKAIKIRASSMEKYLSEKISDERMKDVKIYGGPGTRRA